MSKPIKSDYILGTMTAEAREYIKALEQYTSELEKELSQVQDDYREECNEHYLTWMEGKSWYDRCEELEQKLRAMEDVKDFYISLGQGIEKALDKACELLMQQTEEGLLLCPSEYAGVCACITTENGFECCGDVDFDWKQALKHIIASEIY